MYLLPAQLGSEFKTISAMVKIYCKKHHKTAQLCNECSRLLSYANEKLDRCPYGQNKPTCNKCPIHCYKPAPKAQIKKIMRYAGPRMLIYHPILAIKHIRAEKKAVPTAVPKQASHRHIRKSKP